jgi:7,8-dihydropterin-6-yl-methyl-4-(beta-D-ribofuranosyl)aminobenzene 5'-phosphate synthase
MAPFIALKGWGYVRALSRVERANRARIDGAPELELPEIDRIEIAVLSEFETEEGFLGEAGVSYFLTTPLGTLLFDVGFGPDHQVLAQNAARLGVTLDKVEAVAISHLHPDHMGGIKATRKRQVSLPKELGCPHGQPCFLPDKATAEGFSPHLVRAPRLLAGGIGTTGPLARSLFFFGWTEELALIARIRDKGLVLISGCGHPTVKVLLEMVCRLSDEPLYAVVGGFHFPITAGRGNYPGWEPQMILGTGKPPWRRITDDDLTEAIEAFRRVSPSKVLLSAHDTCDHAIHRMSDELDAEVEVLRAGGSYLL